MGIFSVDRLRSAGLWRAQVSLRIHSKYYSDQSAYLSGLEKITIREDPRLWNPTKINAFHQGKNSRCYHFYLHFRIVSRCCDVAQSSWAVSISSSLRSKLTTDSIWGHIDLPFQPETIHKRGSYPYIIKKRCNSEHNGEYMYFAMSERRWDATVFGGSSPMATSFCIRRSLFEKTTPTITTERNRLSKPSKTLGARLLGYQLY
jgi:hypothetical protein